MITTNLEQQQFEALKRIGNLWERGEMYRIYFNGLDRWFGLEVTRYNSGNISSAKLDGETISNSAAKRIISNLYDAKVYWDYADGKFHGKNIDNDAFLKIVGNIKGERDRIVAEWESGT